MTNIQKEDPVAGKRKKIQQKDGNLVNNMNMECSIFSQLLNKALNQGELISIFTDKEDTEKFSAGFVLNVDEETLLLNSISPEGVDDGFIVININDIYTICYDDQYLKQLKYIHENPLELSIKKELRLSSNVTTSAFYEILDKCKEDNILVAINLSYGTGHYGIIEDIDNEYILLKDIDEAGVEDGVSCFKIIDIVRIFIDDKKLRKIKLLSKYRLSSPPLSGK